MAENEGFRVPPSMRSSGPPIALCTIGGNVTRKSPSHDCLSPRMEKHSGKPGTWRSRTPIVTSSAGEWITVEKLFDGADHIGGMVVRSEQMRTIVKTLTRLGPHNQTVLIEGESGCGKELIAWALHSFGTAPDRPFVTFNCSNLVDTLAEAQLFGHVKGAFTDAREDAIGYFRSADGGTLFLDEIGELPLNLQPKLLRAVENQEIQPVGSTKVYKVNLRLVAATNRDLRAMIKASQFREDLFYRLSSASLRIPPLRERAVAIPCFVAHFIERYDQLFGKKRAVHFARGAGDAVRLLVARQYPRARARDRDRGADDRFGSALDKRSAGAYPQLAARPRASRLRCARRARRRLRGAQRKLSVRQFPFRGCAISCSTMSSRRPSSGRWNRPRAIGVAPRTCSACRVRHFIGCSRAMDYATGGAAARKFPNRSAAPINPLCDHE